MGEIPEASLASVFARVDWLSCNAREARVLTEEIDPQQSARILRDRLPRGGVIVRDGAEGCVVADSDNDVTRVPGFAVESIDTNGAGDCHVGAFAASLAQRRTVLEAARRANAAAAMSVTKRGPATAPTGPELDAFLNQKKTEQSS